MMVQFYQIISFHQKYLLSQNIYIRHLTILYNYQLLTFFLYPIKDVISIVIHFIQNVLFILNLH